MRQSALLLMLLTLAGPAMAQSATGQRSAPPQPDGTYRPSPDIPRATHWYYDMLDRSQPKRLSGKAPPAPRPDRRLDQRSDRRP